jgi:hypothetical protein
MASTVERNYTAPMPGGAQSLNIERRATLPNGATFIQTVSTFDKPTYREVAGWKLPLSDQGLKIVTRVEDWPYAKPYALDANRNVRDRTVHLAGSTFTQLLPRPDASLTGSYDLIPFFIYTQRPLPEPVQLPAPSEPIYNYDLAFRHRYFNMTMGFLQNSTRCHTKDESTCRWMPLGHTGLSIATRQDLLAFVLNQVPLNFDRDQVQTFRTGLFIRMTIANDSIVEWDPNLDIVFGSNYAYSVSTPEVGPSTAGSPEAIALEAEKSTLGVAVGVSVAVVVVVAIAAAGVYFVLQRRKAADARVRLDRLRESSANTAERKASPTKPSPAPSQQPARNEAGWKSGVKNQLQATSS